VFNLIKERKNAFKLVIYVILQVISMTTIDLDGNVEVVFHRWDRHLPLDEKLKTLRDYFNTSSLEEIPFWKLYRAVKKLNSI